MERRIRAHALVKVLRFSLQRLVRPGCCLTKERQEKGNGRLQKGRGKKGERVSAAAGTIKFTFVAPPLASSLAFAVFSTAAGKAFESFHVAGSRSIDEL